MKFLNVIRVLSVSILMLACASKKERLTEDIALIPQPQEIDVSQGSTPINLNLSVKGPNNLILTLKTAMPQFTIEENGDFTLEIIEDPGLPEEHYTLNTNELPITIKTSSASGLFYACQTLIQLLPSEIFSENISEKKLYLPKVTIKDGPRFKWRGLMLDASRHFQTIPEVKRFIDNLAHHKLNVFHWHLTDGHGWRFESKKYPELTNVGAWRNQPGFPVKGKTGKYGGFYTQQEMKEVVAYAKDRGVVIVPEVDMPGHSFAAIASYPHLGCLQTPQPVAYFYEYPTKAQRFPNIPNSTDVLCVSRETTLSFCKDILDEVMEIFPSDYIHIGGDEVTKQSWKECDHCQEHMKSEKLSDEDELQSWFIGQLDNYLTSKGKSLVGWDEILEGGLAKNATVMSWQGEEGGIKAASMGHDVVMSPQTYIYLDHGQSNSTLEPAHWPGHKPLKKVYEYNPVPESLNSQQAQHVLGIQGNVWTVFVHEEWLLDICTWPRAAAIAETGWSSMEKRDWDSFYNRLSTAHRKRMDHMKINYWWEEPHLVGEWSHGGLQGADTLQTKEFNVTRTLSQLSQKVHLLEFLQTEKSMPIHIKTVVLREKSDGIFKTIFEIVVEQGKNEFDVEFPEVVPNREYYLEVTYATQGNSSGSININEVQTKHIKKLPYE